MTEAIRSAIKSIREEVSQWGNECMAVGVGIRIYYIMK